MDDLVGALVRASKLTSIPRSARSRCGARTRNGTACMAQALVNGKCKLHGGASTGIRTAKGLERQRKAASESMRKRWEAARAAGQRSLRNVPDGEARNMKQKRSQTAVGVRHDARDRARHEVISAPVPGANVIPDIDLTSEFERFSQMIADWRAELENFDFSADLAEAREARRSGKLDPQAWEEALEQGLARVGPQCTSKGLSAKQQAASDATPRTRHT